MPPIPPLPVGPPTYDRPSVAGLVAALLLGQHIAAIPARTNFRLGERLEISSLWFLFLQQHALQVMLFLERRARAIRRGEGEMRAVMRNLATHSQSLASYVDGVSPDLIRFNLPSLDTNVTSLLAQPPWQPFGETDARVLLLAKWFKADYMRWVDPVKCPKCGGVTRSTGGAEPTALERQDGAGRVELHPCIDAACGEVRRFARYGRVGTLIRTREGRCGEWAHLFYAFLRCAGIEARYVWNSEDHVWAEYWSPSLEHWVHVDPCEGLTNKPLLYARGWGKKQAFCLAVGPYGAEDVTKAYVDDWGECRARRRAKGWSEAALRLALMELTVSLRMSMFEPERERLERMDACQLAWVEDEETRLEEAAREEMGGRTSGPEDWRATRQELGLQVTRREVRACKAGKRTSMLDSGQIHNLDLRGNASRSTSRLTLTSGPSQTSAVFWPSPVKQQQQSFRCSVVFRLTSPAGAGAADGMAVVFTSARGLGLGGYGLGYQGLGETGDFAVEIDTYRTQDHADDPPTPHISVHSPPHAHHRHSMACTPAGGLPYLSDGREYRLDLLFDGGTRSLAGSLMLPDGEELSLWEATIPPGEGREWFVGVTGSCGGLWQRQEVLEWVLEEVEFERGGGADEAGIEPAVMTNTEGEA